MSDRFQALGAILNELNVPLQIDTVEDRLKVQKAIYLAQTKVPLGYSYGWYLKGPYSTRLTKDYYEYAGQAQTPPSVQLKDSVKSALKSIKDLIAAKPQDASQAQWLELLASVHYLQAHWSLSGAGVNEKIAETKPHLIHLVDSGMEALQQ